jgi:hypothetical protein
MIRPTPAELLARVADALTETVLPELTADEARIQLQVAVLVIRRLAGPTGDLAHYHDTDARDDARTIEPWVAHLPLADPDGARAAVRDALDAPPVPPTAELSARYARLQAVLVDVDAAIRALPPGPERTRLHDELHALLTRMVARHSRIHTTYANW